MNSFEWPGFLIVFVAGLILVSGPMSAVFPRRLRNVILLAFIVRTLGSLLRYWVTNDFYEGGDAGRYYRFGSYYAGMIWHFDFSVFELMFAQFGRWWGTGPVCLISGFVLSLIGPTERGQFLFFSIAALSGLLLFCKAFQIHFPQADLKKYAIWILFWPSIWFWTSSVGKDSLILLSTGLVIYGYTGKGNRIYWLSLILGILLASIIRPHVAGVMIVSVVIAHWISPASRWTPLHWLQGFGILIVAGFVIHYGFANLGLQDIDMESIREYVDYVSAQSSQGGSAIGAPGLTITGLPLAFLNILTRPFPWEISHPLMAAAALELVLFWYIFWLRRTRIVQMIRQWRSNRLLRLAVPLTFLYVLMLGVSVGNLGIIARQRIHILPLLFIWLEALPQASTVESKKPAPVLRPRSIQPKSFALGREL